MIADVEMKADFPSERWFWFDPPFHNGRSALLHKQPDNIYRIDLQLDADADAEFEKRPENVIPRIESMVGEREFKLDWVSIYKFRCARLEQFVHDRVIFVGDSAPRCIAIRRARRQWRHPGCGQSCLEISVDYQWLGTTQTVGKL